MQTIRYFTFQEVHCVHLEELSLPQEVVVGGLLPGLPDVT